MLSKLIAIILTTNWIVAAELLRHQFLLADIWQSHFQQQNLFFPDPLFNGLIWLVWSLCLVLTIKLLLIKYTLLQAWLMSWFMAFGMLWLVLAGLGIFPVKILPYAIPMSLLECLIAGWLLLKLSPVNKRIFATR